MNNTSSRKMPIKVITQLAVAAAMLLFLAMASASEPKLIIVEPDNTQTEVCKFTGEDNNLKLSGDSNVLAYCELLAGVGAPSITAAVVVLPNQVQQGETVDVAWASSGPDEGYSCVSTIETGPVNGLSGWQDSAGISKSGSTSIVASTSGNYELGVSCSAAGADDYTATTSLTVSEQQPGQKPSGLKITVSPSGTIDAGSNATISWSSNNADTCNASSTPPLSGWSGNLSPASGGSKNINNIAEGDYTLSMTCQNSAGSNSTTATLTVEEEDNDDNGDIYPACSERKKLTSYGFTRRANFRPAGQGSGSNFAQIWGNWPGDSGHPKNVELSRNQFVSLKFNSGSHPGQGKRNIMHYDNIKGGDGGTRGQHFGTLLFIVSRCKDDFDIEKIKQDPSTQGKCVAAGTGALKVTMTENKPHECKIEENTDYYLNIVTTPGGYSHNGPPTIEEIEWQCANPEHNTCSALMRPGGSWPYVP